jgi:TetR/AcrR family transcriptional regulator, tetracycline repressor protein
MAMTERPPLTRDRIVAAAIELVDANGVDALSMRKLGAALGVEAMSLYNHVVNKDDVLDRILDQVLAEIELPDPDLPWDTQIGRLAHGFRTAGHRHPGVFPLFGTRSITTLEGFRPLEQSYAALRDAGLSPADALDGFTALASFVFGFVLTELGGLVDRALAQPWDLDAATIRARPHLVEMGQCLAQRDADRQFQVGLDVLLASLAGMVAAAG